VGQKQKGRNKRIRVISHRKIREKGKDKTSRNAARGQIANLLFSEAFWFFRQDRLFL
jgi:hypothetical protein